MVKRSVEYRLKRCNFSNFSTKRITEPNPAISDIQHEAKKSTANVNLTDTKLYRISNINLMTRVNGLLLPQYRTEICSHSIHFENFIFDPYLRYYFVFVERNFNVRL